jgi:predicted Zn-dependent protease with MMP-like domain
MRRAEFERVVDEAVASLPAWAKERIRNVAIRVEDWPPAGSGLLGLYQGTPRPDRAGGDPIEPDRITIYRVPILRAAEGEDAIREEIRITVLHEIAHHFGISEERLRELGYG